MKFYGRTSWVAMLVASLFILACVTINIYFPAEKVESVAGEIVGEVRGLKAEDKDNAEEKEKSETDENSEGKEQSSLLRETLQAFCCSVAWADEVTAVSNPTIRALKESMKTRFTQMKPFYQNGMLNEGDDGYVSLEKTEGLGLKERRNLNNLIEAENKDRGLLYQEVAKALNIDPSQTGRIAEIFAKEWQKSLP